jgi:membrane protein implicated in regulation of membrane protease activity
MALQSWWWVLALLLGILELVSGTFYLLVIAGGAAAGGLVAAGGGPLWLQCIAAAALSVAGAAAVRRWGRRDGPIAPAQRNRDVVADIGERVRVDAWGPDGRARIQYRGTQWTVELAAGEPALAGEYVIREVAGNRLIVARS